MLKNPRSYYLATLLVLTAIFQNRINAETCGKIEAGPVYLHVDVLESGHTVKKVNMPGVKVDGSYLIWKGVCVKPTILYAGKGATQVMSCGFGVGHYTPLTKQISVTPSIGLTYTLFKTTFHIPIQPEYVLHLKENFHSYSPYIGLDISYCFCQGWRVVGMYQYAWSYSRTVIRGQKTTISHPMGSNYGLLVEYDLNNKWSINLGAAYNISLTKEKHGLRGYGVKLGFAYWF